MSTAALVRAARAGEPASTVVAARGSATAPNMQLTNVFTNLVFNVIPIHLSQALPLGLKLHFDRMCYFGSHDCQIPNYGVAAPKVIDEPTELLENRSLTIRVVKALFG